MNKTEFLIGRNGLNLQSGFYPDDLPKDWRFDYYATIFKALSLPIDTDEELDLILSDIAEDDSDFVLVLSIKQEQLTNATLLKELLNSVGDNRQNFILFCAVDAPPSKEVMGLLSNYNLCLKSDKKLGLNLQEVQVLDLVLSFNQYPVLYCTAPLNDMQIRNYLEDIASINTKTVLIFASAEREMLDKTRIIAELLGF